MAILTDSLKKKTTASSAITTLPATTDTTTATTLPNATTTTATPTVTPLATTTATPTTTAAEATAPATSTSSLLSAADQATVSGLQKTYTSLMATGNTEAANAAHASAEAIRAKYGFSGGTDGSQYLETSGSTTNSGLPSATSQQSYINDLYSAQDAANLQALKTAYDANMISTDATAAKIPQQYQDARNSTASSAAVNKAAFNEYAAANGLNSGAGGQAALAQSNTLQNNLSSLDQAQATALADVETQRLTIQTQYQNDIAQAIADGNLAEAEALYAEATRVDDSIVSTAVNQASVDYQNATLSANNSSNDLSALQTKAETLAAYGDFSGYAALGYSASQIANMTATYKAAQATTSTSSSSGSSSGSSSSSYTPTATASTARDTFTADPAFSSETSTTAANTITSIHDAYGDGTQFLTAIRTAIANGTISESDYATWYSLYNND